MTSQKPIMSKVPAVLTTDDQFKQLGRFAEDGFRQRKEVWPNLMSQMLIKNGGELQQQLNAAAEQFANTAKLREMIVGGNFGWSNPDITGERFSVLEAYDPRPFKPELVWPNKTVSTDTARKAVGEYKGTTAQFLQYLIDDQNAGMDFPIAHLASECVDSGGDQCCLYVSRHYGRRYLLLNWLEDDWDEYWRFFSARELPLAA
jgi:hypothetical protein